MNADKLQRLEKNKKFRKKFYSKQIWKSYAIIPPSVILFASLFGLLYLFNVDRLVSLYSIPCVILLIVGTIWLKAVRKYILTQNTSDDKTFLICLSISLANIEGKTINMFSVGGNRHNQNYLEKKKKEILGSISEDGRPAYLISESGLKLVPNTDVYLIIPSLSDRFVNKNEKINVNRYVLFNDSNRIKYLTTRELESFS